MRFRLPALLFLLPLIAGLLTSCHRHETAAEAGIRTQTLYLGNGAEPADLDPQIVTAYTDMNIMLALFEGLTCLDEETSHPVPGTAESWDISPDGLVYTFHLRANARWSNGDPLTAQDFVYSFQRILSPKLASEYSYMLWPLRNARNFNEGRLTDFGQVGAHALDDRTLQLTLGAPCPWLLALTAHQSWFPVHRATIEKFGTIDEKGTRWTRPENLVCNGPFVLEEWTPNARIIVKHNPQYWDAGRGKLQRVVFYPNDNPSTDEQNFRAGQIHITYELPTEKIAAYRAQAPEKLRVDPFLETIFLRFNTTKPPFNNVKLRQALARAINRNAIAHDVLHGSRMPAHALTPPGTAGYTPPPGVPDDFAAARHLLAEAGYPGGKGLPPFEVQIKIDNIHRDMLTAIQEMWKRELGITITVTPLEQKTWIQNWQSYAYQASTERWIGDYVDPSTYLDMWTTDNPNNLTGWSNAAYDHLIAESDRTLDTPKRQALQRQAETILLDEAPIIPIVYGARVFLIHPAVKNWIPNILGLHRYQYIGLQ